MAFVTDPNQENDGTQLNQGGSGVSAGGTTNSSNQTATGKFSNLQSFLNMNQHAPNTASQVGKNVANAQNSQNQNIQGAQGAIGQTSSYDPNAMTNQVNSGDWDSLTKTVNATYQGPQQGSVDVTGKGTAGAIQQGQALGSTAGQQGLLQQKYGRANYTTGENKLDSFLQGRNGQFQQDAATAKAGAKQLGTQANQQNAALNNQAGAVAHSISDTASKTKTGLSDYNTGIVNDVNSKVDQYNKADQATKDAFGNIQNGLANGHASADTLKQLGMDPGGYTYGVDLSQFVKNQGGGATQANVIGSDQVDKYNHINGILGDTSTLDGSQAGSYQAGQNVFDRQGLAAAIQGGQQAYNSQLQPLADQNQNAQDISRWSRGNINAGEKAQVAQRFGADYANSASPQQLAQSLFYMSSGQQGLKQDWADQNANEKQSAYTNLKNMLDSKYHGTIAEDT